MCVNVKKVSGGWVVTFGSGKLSQVKLHQFSVVVVVFCVEYFFTMFYHMLSFLSIFMILFRHLFDMGGYKKKHDFGVKDLPQLLAAIKEVKILGRKPYAVAAAYSYVYNSFKRYLKRFDNQIPNINEATEEDLMRVMTEITGYGAPAVRSILFLRSTCLRMCVIIVFVFLTLFLSFFYFIRFSNR